jgi:pimeloyl-ACP methyl ester carboxylesterase
LSAIACDDSSATSVAIEAPPPTERPLPPPVAVSPEPQGIGLTDPAFIALPDATADYGRLGGAVYQIEVPRDWNGRLVLYMHGFQGLAPKSSVQSPFFRSHLIRNGYAWGASSFSSTALIPGRAADETAALWDHFVVAHGRPEFTYVTGHSMGGAATHIAAERYGERFDGALAVCGFAGQTAQARIVTDWFFAAAYAASVTQTEFDASTDINDLTHNRIVPALGEPAARAVFEDALIAITGGARAFDRLGIQAEEGTNWSRSALLVPSRLGTNAGRDYDFAAGSSVSEEDFEAGVLRVIEDEAQMANFIAGNEITGDLTMPMLTLHTTGDWQVPLDQQILLHEAVDLAGKSNLLVQRAIRDPHHCSTTATEWETAFDDLVSWVEDGVTPAGETLTSGALSAAGRAFTLSPRFGDDAADTVPGAANRVTLQGATSIDGKPADGHFFWIEVISRGLRTPCSFPADVLRAGRYERVVAAATEVRGCGAVGTELYAVTSRQGDLLYAGPIDWPEGARLIEADLEFSTIVPDPVAEAHTTLYGTVLDATGRHLPPGTEIEAFIGETLCGVAALSPVEMDFLGADRYDLLVVGPDSVPGCAFDQPLTLVVDGIRVAQTASHDGSAHSLDLRLD